MRRRLQFERPRSEIRMYGAQMTIDQGIGLIVAMAITPVDDQIYIFCYIHNDIRRRAHTHSLIVNDDREFVTDLGNPKLVGVFESYGIGSIGKSRGLQIRE